LFCKNFKNGTKNRVTGRAFQAHCAGTYKTKDYLVTGTQENSIVFLSSEQEEKSYQRFILVTEKYFCLLGFVVILHGCAKTSFLVHSFYMENKETHAPATGNSALDALFSAGAQFGFIKSRRHPSAKPYIFGVKNKVEIFDLEKTQEALDIALAFVQTVGAKGGSILFVSGKNEAKESITNIASGINQPWVAGRFVGGSLTNFPEIRKRVEKLETLTDQKEKGELMKYTKKERLLIDREIAKLHDLFFGISVMKHLPAAVFVVDAKKESIAVKEAHTMGLPVIALCGSDNNLTEVEYPIPANDSSRTSIEYFLRQVADAYKAGTLLKKDAGAQETVKAA
jgi:small subunit ribosomal protein S2